jgi:hypothetical protein
VNVDCTLLSPAGSDEMVLSLTNCLNEQSEPMVLRMPTGTAILGTQHVIIVTRVPGKIPVISENTPVLESVDEGVSAECRRPAIGMQCPLGHHCTMQHYVQDGTRLKHFTDEELMLLQHACDYVSNTDTEMFQEDKNKKRCTCTGETKCDIKVSAFG